MVKLLIHDYVGHAFTVQLARALAPRFARVTYASFGGFETPKGAVRGQADDPTNFSSIEVNISAPFDKENLIRRWAQQREYARNIERVILQERPDVVMSSAPLEVQEVMQRACKMVGAGFVSWVQDIHAEAIARILGRKNRVLGRAAGHYYRRKEAQVLNESAANVLISDGFAQVLSKAPWHVDLSKTHIIENWANIDDVPVMDRDNDWALTHMQGRPRIVYSGTLARKHDPDLLLVLAQALDADIYVFAQGGMVDVLREKAQSARLENLFIAPWVSVADLPKMLAGADVLLGFIEPEAGVFSVPSKVLSYMAAARPILASIPADNLAARKIVAADAGLVSAPGDIDGLLDNARSLLASQSLRARLGANGRRYAEGAFDIVRISDQFETLLTGVAEERAVAR